MAFRTKRRRSRRRRCIGSGIQVFRRMWSIGQENTCGIMRGIVRVQLPINTSDRNEAEALSEATVHWLRHTGISEDVEHWPREHVRDNAGHSSSAITDKYIDIELRARHASGRRKRVKPV